MLTNTSADQHGIGETHERPPLQPLRSRATATAARSQDASAPRTGGNLRSGESSIMLARQQTKCGLLVFGETTRDTIANVDALPLAEGAAARVLHISEATLGGRAVNVATYAKLCGVDAHILSACDRSYVEEYQRLKLAHADVSGVFTSNNAPRAWMFRTKAHQVTFFRPGAAIVTGADRTPSAEQSYKDHLYQRMKGYSPRFVYCTSELHGVVDDLMKHYSGNTVRIFSPGPEVQLIGKPQLKRILNNTDILFLNYSEMLQIEYLLEGSLQEIMRTYKLRVAVATMGRVGAILL